jgi:hypothetical protein
MGSVWRQWQAFRNRSDLYGALNPGFRWVDVCTIYNVLFVSVVECTMMNYYSLLIIYALLFSLTPTSGRSSIRLFN